MVDRKLYIMLTAHLVPSGAIIDGAECHGNAYPYAYRGENISSGYAEEEKGNTGFVFLPEKGAFIPVICNGRNSWVEA